MKFLLKLTLTLVALTVVGCAKKAAETQKAREDADAKARADAAKKEMATLPKVFSTPDYLKKNEPPKTSTTAQPVAEAPKK